MATCERRRMFLTIVVVILETASCLSGVIEDTSMGHQDVRIQCGQWVHRGQIKATLRNVSRPLVCPCSEQLMQYDNNFRKTGPCYEEFFFQDGVKIVCCYSAAGDLNLRGKYSGYIMVEQYKHEIKQVRELCCHDNDLCDLIDGTSPLEDCHHYKTPTVLRSWGDAHIQTVTGDKYDFNGLGEYIYLDVNGTFQIQCRLEYYSDTNHDATIFTAFALRVKNNTWEVKLNRTSGELINAPRSPVVHTLDRGDGTLLVMLKGFRFPPMSFTGGDQISLSFLGRLPMTMDYKGLVGNSTGGFQLRNKAKIEYNSSARKIYDFGQSWKLTDISESIFTYSSPDRNFTYYNRNAPKPIFPEDYLSNISNMFVVFGNHNETEIQEYMKLCNVSDDLVKTRCLVSIARTNKIEDGNTIIKEYNRQLDITRLENIAKDHPPKFNSTFPDGILVKLNLNKTLTLKVGDYVTDNDTDEKFTYVVSADGNITYDIDNENGTLTFHVDKNFRDFQGGITVIVTDKWGKSDTQPFKFIYCGCEHPNQCGTVYSTSLGDASSMSVKQVQCDCSDYHTGSYCEINLDVCNITQCHPGVTCNGTVDVYDDTSNPCGPCPDGYSGDGINCTEVRDDHGPRFTSSFPDDILVKLHLNKTLTLKVSDYVTDNDTDETFTYEVRANGNITYDIDVKNGTLTFHVDENFRDYQGGITVIVTDKLGKSDSQSFKFSYCGCEHPNQCGTVVNNTSSGDAYSMSVKQLTCNCNKYFAGSYCQIELDVCNITQCHPGVTCNKTANVYDDTSNPCGPCPDGYSGDGINCTVTSSQKKVHSKRRRGDPDILNSLEEKRIKLEIEHLEQTIQQERELFELNKILLQIKITKAKHMQESE